MRDPETVLLIFGALDACLSAVIVCAAVLYCISRNKK
jgi:hypothetical protein